MGYHICDTWADWFWSSARGRSGIAVRTKAMLRCASVPCSHDLDSLPESLLEFPLPMHVVVPSAEMRRCRDNIKAQVISDSLPQNAFWKLDDSWYIASPELTFVQLGAKLGLSELIAVGYEYCGCYAIDPLTGHATFGLNPVTTVERLRNFVDACPGIRGVKMARKAIEYVRGNSASPMETALHMRFSLMARMGGYGLPVSQLNHEVKLNANARRIYKRGSVRFDLFFAEAKLDVEFHGGDHESKMASDAARDAAIKCMGFDTATITIKQYRDYLAMGEIVRSIAQKHGISLRKDQVGFTPARAKLYRELELYRTGQRRR